MAAAMTSCRVFGGLENVALLPRGPIQGTRVVRCNARMVVQGHFTGIGRANTEVWNDENRIVIKVLVSQFGGVENVE